MTNKERLEKIKNEVFNAIDWALSNHDTLEKYEIDIDDLNFLIEQAEKAITK
jgi:hypothetical protein